jgi:Sporulation and spore germination
MQGNRLLFGVAIIIAVLVASGGGLFWLWRNSTNTDPMPAVQDQQTARQLLRDEPLSITLYYPHEGMLVTESTLVKRQPDTQSLARAALMALFADQRVAQEPVLRDIRLRELYLDGSGTAYIDLTPGPRKDVRASAWEEQLAIYALVNTLQQNFEEIKQVRLLLDGREAQTLAGHMDLSRTFTKRMDLVKQ